MHCKYCYRDYCRNKLPSTLSNDVKLYLQNLNPNECECVCMSGGEPLIYFERIKDVLSFVPQNIHKKIMTNGLLLSQEIVDYANTNNIEIAFSHDGEYTEYLRGVDILKDTEIISLLQQIKILSVGSVVTKYNPNVIKTYNYIRDKIKRDDFIYRPLDLMDTGNIDELIEDFDYDVYARSITEYHLKYFKKNPYYARVSHKHANNKCGFNVDLAGNVIGMNTLRKYGTIYDTYEECLKRMLEIETNYCKQTNCPCFEDCYAMKQAAGKHFCKVVKIRSGYY